MKLICVRILAEDFAAELKFYREVMQLVDKYVDENIRYAYMGFDASDPEAQPAWNL